MLPDRVSVRLSSEEAGAISLTPVVSQEMSTAELIELMLPLTGKDVQRIRDAFRRGNWVEGASRFRWQGFEITGEQIAGVLAGYPDPDPSRAFDASKCTSVRLSGNRSELSITREAGSARKLFARETFWRYALEIGERSRYVSYDYRRRADRYDLAITAELDEELRKRAALIANRRMRRAALAGHFTLFSAFVPR
jgi:hypothetical protein